MSLVLQAYTVSYPCCYASLKIKEISWKPSESNRMFGLVSDYPYKQCLYYSYHKLCSLCKVL